MVKKCLTEMEENLMKVVIIGAGKVGSSLSYSLSGEGHDVTVVDNNSSALQRIQDSQDVMCVEGDGANAQIQIEANINKAGLLIATTPYDELNILCCLLAKRLGAQRTISRVRNPVYFKQMHLIRDDLKLSLVINPELTTAAEILRILIFPSAVKVEVFSKGKIELVEHNLNDDTVLDGLTLAEIYRRFRIKFLICTVQRDSKIFIPSGDFILRAGDKINIASSHSNLENFFRTIGALKNKVKTVMIVGGGKICHYLVDQLLTAGMRVKIVEYDMDKCKLLAEHFPKATIINGDGTDQALLDEEGISEVDAFIALTGIDEENIIMSLYAKSNSNAKVITKINRENYCQLAAQIGLDCIISPKGLMAGGLLSFVRSINNTAGSNIEALYHIVDGKAEAIEFKVNSHIEGLINIPLKDIKLKKNILICAIIKKREIIIPNGDDRISLGDSVIVISKDYRFADIEDILD